MLHQDAEANMGWPAAKAIAALFIALGIATGAAAAEGAAISKCLAVADATPHRGPEIQPRVILARLDAAPLAIAGAAQSAQFDYIAHATWLITSPGGVTAATDFAGWALSPPPTIATMNNAHRTHWTVAPDPSITHVLRGWSEDGVNPARHALVEGDMLVRNVATDTRLGGEMTANGNSIFIFETADLCIGHLGHLHHPLDDRHYAEIGRLDIIMVPVDGGLTLSHQGMGELMRRLRPSVLLPMHLRGNSIGAFIAMLGDGFESRYLPSDNITFSLDTLPETPTVFVPASLN
jgi:Beta-lactamase superfamily domain